MSSGQSGKLVIIAVFVLAVAGVGVFALTRGGDDQPARGGDGDQGGDEPAATQDKDAVAIDFVYSTEKKGWISEAIVEFHKKNPDIKVELIGKGSLTAVREILDGKVKPTVWSPADTVALNLLGNDWFQKERKKLFPDAEGEDRQDLVLTPLVFVSWEDRGNVLTEQNAKPVTWKLLQGALSSSEGWKTIGGPAEWGLIRLGHTDPTKSNSGLQALLLMAYEYHDKSAGLEVSDALDPKFQEFVKSIEKNVPKFGTSTGTFMKEMILYGPSKYDVVVAYENLAIEQLPNAQGRWGNLKVYYPQKTMWSSHPAVVLDGDWVTDAQRKAGRRLLAFLRSADAQKRALRYGFRPADPSIPILGEDADNPFSTAKAYGIEVNVAAAVEPPPGPVISNLMEMWSRNIGR